MNYEVIVELKEEVLDTQGRAIQQALGRLGHKDLKSVKVTKRFVIAIDGHEKDAEALATQIAREHLANPVAETFQVRKL
jgi:phosphoribosylformylglycinamidine synthase subunit PurS